MGRMSTDPSIPPPTPPPSIEPVTPPADPYATPVAPPPAAATMDDNTVAFVCYLTLIGFIVALVINSNEKKNSLGQFHLRQMLGLIIVSFVGWFGMAIMMFILGRIPFLGPLLGLLLYAAFAIGIVAAWFVGFLDALNRRQKPIPVIGPIIQDKLKNVFV